MLINMDLILNEEDGNNINIVILRYVPSSSDNEYYRADLVENGLNIEKRTSYAGAEVLFDTDTIKFEKTTTHTFKATAKNGYYLYMLPSAYYPDSGDFEYMWSYGQNGTVTKNTAHYRSVQVFIVSKDPVRLVS